MIDITTLNAIGNASSESEQHILCDLYDIAYDQFKQIWPYEKLGQNVLKSTTFFIKSISISKNGKDSCIYDIIFYAYELSTRTCHDCGEIILTYDMLIEIPSLFKAVEEFYIMNKLSE